MTKLSPEDFHPHFLKRMEQRGITKEEIKLTLNNGKPVEDAKVGTLGKVCVFDFNDYWESNYYKQKEVTIYYKQKKVRLFF